MNSSPVLLSISMLISGREEMKKSLDSLLYFKNAFSAEIILVDTGCNVEQRALAEKYADKIIDFGWRNDFAAARNTGLKEAHGEWFMYLDDDEWFENPQEIISFFVSGEYKKYGSASYVVRNYRNFAGTMYEESYPARMVRLTKNTKFIGKIHEYLDPFEHPKKCFSDYVHHYGYVYKNAEEKKKHAERNLALLCQTVKENPGEPRWSCQLAQEYFASEKYEETIKCCQEGLKEWEAKKNEKNYAPAHVGALYCYMLYSLALSEKYEEEEEWLERAFADSILKYEFMEPTGAFYCQAAARLYSVLGQHERCVEYLERYLTFAQKYKDDRTAIEAGAAAIAAGVFQMQILYGTILLTLKSAILEEKYKLVEEAFYTLEWSDRRLLCQNEPEKNLLDACCGVAYHPLWTRMLQTLVSREDGMKEMYVVFLETEVAYKEHGETEKLFRLYRLVSELDFEHRYILCCRILWTEKNPELETGERKDRLTELYTELFKKYADGLFEIRDELWEVAERFRIPMEQRLLSVNYNAWRYTLNQWSRTASAEELLKWNARILTWQTTDNIRYRLFNLKYEEGYLRTCQKSQLALKELEKLLWKYADDAIALYKPYYREFAFTDEAEILPGDVQLALKLKRLQEYRQQGKTKETLRQIKECIAVYPPMEAAISEYAGRLRDEIQSQMQEQSAAKTELEGVVISLKKAAQQYLESGEKDAARDILLQIQACMPEDQEVKALIEDIHKR